MRIIAGRWRGRAMAAPGGRGTRPTADRTREAIFNVLAHADWAPALAGARVIDLFAGTGALGFEALSRGAAFALFVETDAAARGAIRASAEAFDILGATRIHRRDAALLGVKPAGLGAPFDVAFLDPPYGKGLADRSLAALAQGGWLRDGAAAVVEVGADDPAPSHPGFVIQDLRRYGAAQVAFLTCSGG